MNITLEQRGKLFSNLINSFDRDFYKWKYSQIETTNKTSSFSITHEPNHTNIIFYYTNDFCNLSINGITEKELQFNATQCITLKNAYLNEKRVNNILEKQEKINDLLNHWSIS